MMHSMTMEDMMYSWPVSLILMAIGVWLAWRILTRAGFSGAWALLTLVPLVNLVALWIFAFRRWPRDDPRS